MSEATLDSQGNDGDTSGIGGEQNESPGWLIPALIVLCIGVALLGELIVGYTAANPFMESIGRFQHVFFPAPHGQLGDPPEWLIERRNDMMKNNAIGFGAFGAMLLGVCGALLGIATAGRNPIIGLLVGAVTGLLAGAITAPISYYIEDSIRQIDMDGSLKAALILGLIFICFGLAGAMVAVCSGPSRSFLRGLANGLAAGIVALVLYILATALFPLGFPESTFPLHAGVRYTLFVCLALCPALAVILTLRSDQPKAVPE